MRHKKKRTQNQAAGHGQQPRNPDKLDYSDESSAADSPLDSQEYQRAIRAHLNEFEDMATNSMNGYAAADGPDRHAHALPKVPPLPPMERHVSHGKLVPRKAAKPTNGAANAGRPKDRIWNTTTNEERERIKEFWLNLGEEERKSLVKVEKEAVLKKMKEQQKHSCSCSVCGRKRTAIEEELEVLYDAYYEELEQYANQQQFPAHPAVQTIRHGGPRHHRQSRITEVLHSDDSEGSFDEEDGLSQDDLLTDDDLSEEDEDYSDEEYEEDHAPPEFFKFGNSLTVKGGILTVADDLLKNDGKKFIEMMEQLAERRMQREEEAAMEAREYDEEEDEDDYDDDDLESDDYDDEDEEEQDALTEEQRMAEGRRMFQIFAARMFEQRVLTAYREKVAQERQAQLLQELELEDSREKEREAKKLKEKEKKKDKKRQQQLKKEEEKAKKDAERLAEEAAAKAEEERKAEEARKRKEEQRLKREAEKKAVEAERIRKEDEKRKRIADEKAREAKRLEQVAKEKKAKEEAQRKERDAKEAAARELKARKEAERAQRDTESAKAESRRLASAPTPATGRGTSSRKISPSIKTASPAQSASPAIPIAYASGNKETLHHPQQQQQQYQSRPFQDAHNTHSGPRNIPNSTQQQQHQQQQHQMSRTITPGAISPQPYGSHQNSFPRAALGHPPSMPVPLPPPGIGAAHNANPLNHDPFGFNSLSQQQQGHATTQGSLHSPVRANGMPGAQIPGIQGPPGVFSTAPGMSVSTSPQSRIGTPQGNRLSAFNSFNSLGVTSAGTPREEFISEPELSFARRPNGLVSEAATNGVGGPGVIGGIGAIGRPSPARNGSLSLPAPIQRPSSILPPPTATTIKRSGFEGIDVMGSRALLDDDEDDPVAGTHLPSAAADSLFHHGAPSWTASVGLGNGLGNGLGARQGQQQQQQKWTGSAALNGPIDEPYHPPPKGAINSGGNKAAPVKDRWAAAAGTIGVKPEQQQQQQQPSATAATTTSTTTTTTAASSAFKTGNWGF